MNIYNQQNVTEDVNAPLLKRSAAVILIIGLIIYIGYKWMQLSQRVETLRAQSNELAARSLLNEFYFTYGGALLGIICGWLIWMEMKRLSKKRI